MPASTSILRKHAQKFLWTASLVLVLSAVLFAQGYFGTVSGVLSDATGAVVPDAKVVLSDVQKGFTFTANSDSNGRYLFRSIPPGLYSVTAEVKGFQKAASARFKVDVNENATADLTLKVAGGAQTVTVEAEAQHIQTEDAETGQVVNRRFINDLPLIDRNVQDLTYLAPGIVDTTDVNHASDTGGTNFVSNGSRGASADILMDGASTTNAEPNGGITQGTYTPSPEAVEEFKVQQSNFSAEYGFSGASVINMVTRSGTNQFHGSVYDFYRDQVLDANDWFADHTGQAKPHLRRNDYGLTIGGPIRKNKTFFFFDYEGWRQAGLQNAHFGVPSQAMRTGDFGEICPANGNTDSSGNVHPGAWDTTVGSANYGQCVQADDPTMTTLVPSGQLWDPYSGVFDSNQNGAVRSTFIPFNNIAQYISPGCNPNALPSGNSCPPTEPTPGVAGNLIDPVALKMMSYFPLPNSPGNIYANWFGSGTSKNNNDQFDLRIDHRFSDKNLMSAKYSQQWTTNANQNCFKNFTDPCGNGPSKNTAHLFTINDTYTINSTLLLNVILGFTRGAENIQAYNPQGVSDPLGTLGFPSYLYSNTYRGVPPIFISQYSTNGGTNIGTDPYGNYKLGQDTGQLTVALDKVHGQHELKFGFEGRIHQMNYIQTNAPLGFFSFDFNGSSQCPNNIAGCGGDGMASFLMGQLTQDCVGNEGCGSYYEIQFRPATANYQYAGYAQDNWKLNRKLTLNLGLRYDVTLPRTERFNRQNSFDLNVTSPLNNGSITYNDAVSGQPVTVPLTGGEVFATSGHRTDYVTDWSNIQPRFGFAYQFAPKMVVRGGYGIYYGQSRSGVSGVVPYGSQGFNQYTFVPPSTYQNQGNVPWLHLNNPFPYGLIQPPGSSLGLMNDVGYGANGTIEAGAYNRTPYEQSWSLGIERELPGNVVMNVEYLGKKGTHLPFSGTTQHDVLGPWVEGLAAGDPNASNPCNALTVGCLNNLVTNPFSSANGGPISDPNSTLSSQQVQYFQLLLPHPQFTSITSDVQLIADSTYHALQISGEKRYSNGLQFLVTYTWSKSIDDSSIADDNVTWTGSSTSLQDPNKPWLERSLSTFDIPQVLQASYSYDLPFGHGRRFLGNMPGFLEAIVGGWKTNGIWRFTSGRPLSMTLADGQALPTYNAQRPDIVGTPRRAPRRNQHDWVDANGNNYFVDPTVFQKPTPFTLGDAPRTIGSVRTPSWFNTDLSLGKQFSLARVREAMNLEFRIESQNTFNHPVFGTPDTNVDDGSTGMIFYTASTPRQVQLALKVNF